MGQRVALLGGLAALCAASAPALAVAYDLAPAADPLAQEIVRTCSGAIAAHALPEGDGWRASGPVGREARTNPDTRYADKDVDGVGLLHLRLHSSVVDGDELSSCGVTIDKPGKQFRIADFGMADGLVGSVDGDKGIWFGADSKLFVTVLQQAAAFSFAMDEIADAKR